MLLCNCFSGLDFKHLESKDCIQFIIVFLSLHLHRAGVNKMGHKNLLSKPPMYVLYLKHLRYKLVKDFVKSETK